MENIIENINLIESIDNAAKAEEDVDVNIFDKNYLIHLANHLLGVFQPF